MAKAGRPIYRTRCEKIDIRWAPHSTKDDFTPVSNFFLENYGKLNGGITNQEAMFIVHLMLFKHDERNPFPSYQTIADRMEWIDPDTVRGYARSLEDKGLLLRLTEDGRPVKEVPGYRKTVRFDLSQLFDALNQLQRSGKGVRKRKRGQLYK